MKKTAYDTFLVAPPNVAAVYNITNTNFQHQVSNVPPRLIFGVGVLFCLDPNYFTLAYEINYSFKTISWGTKFFFSKYTFHDNYFKTAMLLNVIYIKVWARYKADFEF